MFLAKGLLGQPGDFPVVNTLLPECAFRFESVGHCGLQCEAQSIYTKTLGDNYGDLLALTLDEKTLAACMAYVDLNPIRANMAPTPEASEFTSIQQRIKAAKDHASQPSSLFPFVGNPKDPMPEGLPFHLAGYIQLVEWTGRIVRDDKRGAIHQDLPDVLQRLKIDANTWKTLSTQFESKVSLLVGDATTVKEKAGYFGYQRLPTTQHLKTLFG